jgi:hypothetical protein
MKYLTVLGSVVWLTSGIIAAPVPQHTPTTQVSPELAAAIPSGSQVLEVAAEALADPILEVVELPIHVAHDQGEALSDPGALEIVSLPLTWPAGVEASGEDPTEEVEVVSLPLVPTAGGADEVTEEAPTDPLAVVALPVTPPFQMGQGSIDVSSPALDPTPATTATVTTPAAEPTASSAWKKVKTGAVRIGKWSNEQDAKLLAAAKSGGKAIANAPFALAADAKRKAEAVHNLGHGINNGENVTITARNVDGKCDMCQGNVKPEPEDWSGAAKVKRQEDSTEAVKYAAETEGNARKIATGWSALMGLINPNKAQAKRGVEDVQVQDVEAGHGEALVAVPFGDVQPLDGSGPRVPLVHKSGREDCIGTDAAKCVTDAEVPVTYEAVKIKPAVQPFIRVNPVVNNEPVSVSITQDGASTIVTNEGISTIIRNDGETNTRQFVGKNIQSQSQGANTQTQTYGTETLIVTDDGGNEDVQVNQVGEDM